MGILFVAVLLTQVPMSLADPEPDPLQDEPRIDTDHAAISTSLSWTFFDRSLGLKDAIGTSFVFGWSASMRSDEERWAARRGEEAKTGYFSWGPIIGMNYSWSEMEATGRRARVLNYYGGYQITHHWPNGLNLGGTLKVGQLYVDGGASGPPGRKGTLVALSAPEVSIKLGWGFEVGAAASWETAVTSLNSDHRRWIIDVTPALTLTWGF